MRGSRTLRGQDPEVGGSIPAGAGEPLPRTGRHPRCGVYPRGCGGASTTAPAHVDDPGLSPRVRGSLQDRQVCGALVGSIPAGAGEPSHGPLGPRASGVYPRGCGGAAANLPDRNLPAGLSPRVRGSHTYQVTGFPRGRSIPAGAGEPPSIPSRRVRNRVYPRGCGGAQDVCGIRKDHPGLSPRVRGSPPSCAASFARQGSIPAGAGEPGWNGIAPRRSRVYPRGCGGASCWRGVISYHAGLSPRVRGSLAAPFWQDRRVGSIPAGAGEPLACAGPAGGCGVYPRGCGGAQGAQVTPNWSQGLSPRVRGSLLHEQDVVALVGSIPAGAGEPAATASRYSRSRVYPRGCGGAAPDLVCAAVTEGLSPRVRGSPTGRLSAAGRYRSIPAGAGEPPRHRLAESQDMVYPRGCGGAPPVARAHVP